ncbi:MAG: glycosyltransferase [Acidobacteria bacterium]|nr:glycosyltransferase [Acidobacteriota bacterium]
MSCSRQKRVDGRVPLVILAIFFWIYLVLGLAYWGAAGFFTWLSTRRVRLDPALPGVEGNLPSVLVLVPARNESRAIEACLRSLLAQDYPRLRILLADDGSTDGTREIAERIADGEDRLDVIAAGELPDGWMGKCWALHRAYEEARTRKIANGSLLLFTDADIFFHPRTVSIAVRRLLDEKLDLIGLLPRTLNGSFWERTIQPAVIHGLLVLGAITELFPAKDYPRIASGAFILIRPEFYRIAGGHFALRHKLIEDIALATTVHMRGGKTAAFHAPDLIRLRMYHNLGEIWRGWAKNFFAGTNDNLRRSIELAAMFLLFSVLPVFLFPALLARSLGTGQGWWWAASAGLLYGAMTAVRAAGNRLTGESPIYAFLHPLAGVFLAGVVIASTWSRRFGRGALWRGRRYPIRRTEP